MLRLSNGRRTLRSFMLLEQATCVLPLLCAASPAPARADATARLSVRMVDESGQPTPARAWVEVGDQRHFQPTKPSTAVVYAKDQSFNCDGAFEIDVPAARAEKPPS